MEQPEYFSSDSASLYVGRIQAGTRFLGGWPWLLILLTSPTRRVPLDKSEGGVKDKSILSVFLAPLFCQRGLRTKTLEMKISR
jgi:hypothetical protein